MSAQFFLFIDGERKGPFRRDDLLEAGLKLDTPVCTTVGGRWVTAGAIPELVELIARGSRQERKKPPPLPVPPSKKEIDDELEAKAFPNQAKDLDGSSLYGHPWKSFYQLGMILYWIGIIFPLIGVLLHSDLDPKGNWETPVFLLLGISMLPFASLLFLITLYRAWKTVQDGEAATTPGKAIGFLFIPLFNLYWVFVTYFGLAKEFHRLRDRYQIDLAEFRPLGQAVSICSVIPFLAPFNLILWPIFISHAYHNAIRVDGILKKRQNLNRHRPGTRARPPFQA